MTSAATIVRSTDGPRSFVTRQLAGETLIMPLAGRVAEIESIYVLNEVASRIWELLAAPTTVDTIATTIANEFTVSTEDAVGDVNEFLAALRTRDLIRSLPEAS